MLERVAIEAASKHGWSVVGIEYGLHGMLATRLPRTIVQADATPGDLAAAAEQARHDAGTDVSIAVSITEGDRTAEIALATPQGVSTRSLTYGGPPRSLARWATNLALNWLRTVSEDAN